MATDNHTLNPNLEQERLRSKLLQAQADLRDLGERLTLADQTINSLRESWNQAARERDDENRQKRQVYGAYMITVEQLADALGFRSIEGYSTADFIDMVKAQRAALMPFAEAARETRESRYSVHDTLSVTVLYSWLRDAEKTISKPDASESGVAE